MECVHGIRTTTGGEMPNDFLWVSISAHRLIKKRFYWWTICILLIVYFDLIFVARKPTDASAKRYIMNFEVRTFPWILKQPLHIFCADIKYIVLHSTQSLFTGHWYVIMASSIINKCVTRYIYFIMPLPAETLSPYSLMSEVYKQIRMLHRGCAPWQLLSQQLQFSSLSCSVWMQLI